MARSATVLLAMPSEIVRMGIQDVFGAIARIVGVANSGKQAVTLAKKLMPSVVLLSDRLPDADAFDVAAKLIAAKTKVVMLGVDDNPTYLARASAVGASDFVFEGSAPKMIVDSVLGAAAGTKPSPDGAFRKVQSRLQDPRIDAQIDLTPREQQVLRHIAYGLSNNEIAISLRISVETVKEHVQKVLRKMGMEDRTHVAIWAVKSGVV